MSYPNQSYEYPHYDGQYQGQAPALVSPPLGHSNTDAYPQGGRGIEYSYPPPPPPFTAFSPVKSATKRVTFKPTCTVRTHTRHPRITSEEKSQSYYTKQELKIMNLEAHAICTLSQELPDIRNPGTLLTMDRRASLLGLDDRDNNTFDTLRGLELIMYPKRKQNKALAQRSLIKYQTLLNSKSNMSPERKCQALAVASVKLNLWSSLVAMETARLDALRAYDGDYLIPIAQPVNIISPFPFYKKRQRTTMARRGSRRITFDKGEDDMAQQQNKRGKVENEVK